MSPYEIKSQLECHGILSRLGCLQQVRHRTRLFFLPCVGLGRLWRGSASHTKHHGFCLCERHESRLYRSRQHPTHKARKNHLSCHAPCHRWHGGKAKLHGNTSRGVPPIHEPTHSWTDTIRTIVHLPRWTHHVQRNERVFLFGLRLCLFPNCCGHVYGFKI